MLGRYGPIEAGTIRPSGYLTLVTSSGVVLPLSSVYRHSSSGACAVGLITDCDGEEFLGLGDILPASGVSYPRKLVMAGVFRVKKMISQ